MDSYDKVCYKMYHQKLFYPFPTKAIISNGSQSLLNALENFKLFQSFDST